MKRTITLSQLDLTITYSLKDNSPRGCHTVYGSELKIGDKIVIDNYFTEIVEEPTAEPTETEKKLSALKNHLIEEGHATEEELQNATVENTFNEDWNTFEIIGKEYKVLTEEEADETAKNEIYQSLWAFNADFILRHTAFYEESTQREDAEFVKALQQLQGNLCESANALVKALIIDLDDFADDAIIADGRGHFISWYDGEEHEQGDFYIYRTN